MKGVIVVAHFRFVHEIFEEHVPVRRIEGERSVEELVESVLREVEGLRAAITTVESESRRESLR